MVIARKQNAGWIITIMSGEKIIQQLVADDCKRANSDNIIFYDKVGNTDKPVCSIPDSMIIFIYED